MINVIIFIFIFFFKYELIPVNMTVFFHARWTFQWREMHQEPGAYPFSRLVSRGLMITKKKKKIPSDCECVRAREKDETWAAPQSGLHLSTGPQWIQPTVQDYIYSTICEGAVYFVHRVCFAGLFVWKGYKHKAKSLPGFFFFSLSLSFALFPHW